MIRGRDLREAVRHERLFGRRRGRVAIGMVERSELAERSPHCFGIGPRARPSIT